jgi:hypothetical protein
LFFILIVTEAMGVVVYGGVVVWRWCVWC